MESKKIQSIEELNDFLSGPYPYGYNGLTIEALLKEYGHLKEFYLTVRNLAGAVEAEK